MTDFTFRSQPTAFTESDIARNVAALGYPKGWAVADDVALMEGLFQGLGLQAIGAKMGKPFGETQARFLALRRAAVGHDAFTLTAQTALLNIVRARAGGVW